MKSFRVLLASLLLSLPAVQSASADISTARNFHRFNDQVLTSGQPDAALLRQAGKDAIAVVINLVPSSEGIYNPDEAEILRRQGIEYIHNPVSWGAPKAAELSSFLDAMEQVGDRKVLVHCWSNARASALVYAYRVSQAPHAQAAEFEGLKRIWQDVAGYSLDGNATWQAFLADHVGTAP